MTALRQRFIEDLQLHGFAASTQQVYVTAIKLLARHYGLPPDQLTEEQIRQYFLHLTNDRKVSRSNATITLCAIKFLYEQTLQRPWPVFRVVRPRREHKIPAVMSREEVRRLLECFRTPFYRVFFTTVYACGLRVSEGVQLQVSDVDGQRLLLHVCGKGSKDRYVPLPVPLLNMLRRFWKTHRSVPWLFPSPWSEGSVLTFCTFQRPTAKFGPPGFSAPGFSGVKSQLFYILDRLVTIGAVLTQLILLNYSPKTKIGDSSPHQNSPSASEKSRIRRFLK